MDNTNELLGYIVFGRSQNENSTYLIRKDGNTSSYNDDALMENYFATYAEACKHLYTMIMNEKHPSFTYGIRKLYKETRIVMET